MFGQEIKYLVESAKYSLKSSTGLLLILYTKEKQTIDMAFIDSKVEDIHRFTFIKMYPTTLLSFRLVIEDKAQGTIRLLRQSF